MIGVEILDTMISRMTAVKYSDPIIPTDSPFCATIRATRAIDKGMPVEQVQKLLGHSQIDTTMQYAIVNQSNVKESHRRYIA